MIGLDVAARGLAKSAFAHSLRQGTAPALHGARGDGLAPDDPAFAAVRALFAAASERTLRLESKTYAFTESGGLTWDQSDSAILGQGMSRSILRQTNHAISSGSARTLHSCENLLLQDLTLHGANGYGALYVPQGQTVENVVFNRVRFASDPQNGIDGAWFGSTNGIRWVCDTGSAREIWLIDCVFENCGRMGLEFQNHGTGSTVRIGNIHIVRPRFVHIGQANASAGHAQGMGISLSGYMDDILIDRPWFDHVDRLCVEMVGCSRTRIRDMMVRHDTLGSGLIAATNAKPMHGNAIDGLRWCGSTGSDILAEIPQVTANIRLDNWNDGVVRNVQLRTTGVKALELGVNYPSSRNLVEANSLHSDQPNVIANIQSGANIFRGNRIESSYSGAVSHIAIQGNDSVECLVDGNRFIAPAASSWNPIALTGAVSARFTRSNRLNGKKTEASGTLTISSGTQYADVLHGLAGVPAFHLVTPRSRVHNGTTDLSWFSDFDGNTINVQTSANVGANVTFHWYAELVFGNL